MSEGSSTWRSPAVWIAIAALIVALGGTATAARTLIGSNDIANGAIKARHIAPNAVTPAKINAVAKAQLRGQAGAPGLNGLNGGFDPNKLTYVTGPDLSIPSGTTGTAVANCPPGTKATGGGYFSSITDEFTTAPFANGSGWFAQFDNTSLITVNVRAFAVCATP